MKCVSTILDPAAIERVNALRLSEYAKASGFAVQPAGILWNRSDDQCTVLGAWDGEELVSTMRLELVQSPALLEAKLECPWSYPVDLAYPVMLLSKAATRSGLRGGGYNALLRWWAFALAKQWGVRHVVGTLTAGSPRERSMREMGYRFFENAKGWNTTNYRSTDPVLVAVLDVSENIETAMDVCAHTAGPLLPAFPWRGASAGAKIVEVVR
jgi:hypothetical protein